MAKKLKELLVDKLRHEVAEIRSIILAEDYQIADQNKRVEGLEDKADGIVLQKIFHENLRDS